MKNVLGRLAGEMKRIRGGIAFGSLLAALGIALSLIAPMVLSEIFGIFDDFYLTKTAGAATDAALMLSRTGRLLLIVLALYLGQAVCNALRSFVMINFVSRHFTCEFRIRQSAKLNRLPIGYINRIPHGEILSRQLADVSNIGNSVHSIVDVLVAGILQLLALIAVMIVVSPLLALCVVAVLPISFFVSVYIAGKSEKNYDETQMRFGRLYSLVEESYTGFATVKANNLESERIARHDEINSEIVRFEGGAMFLSGMIQPIVSLINNVAYIMVCLLGGYLAVKGRANLQELVAILMYASMFASPMESIANGVSGIQRVKASAKRVYELLDEREETDATGKTAISGRGDVVFEDVSFGYGATPLFEHLSLEVSAGQKIALVGKTGAGKTTIVNMLMRFYDISAGRILIDGVDINSVPRAKVRSLFAMVLQDTWLFHGTVMENIRYSRPEASDDEVVAAAREAYCDHFIRTLPEGYNTVIDENSLTISGGQKQLLTIARAFISNRKLIILDEATSNVDTRTELLIQKAMDTLMEGRTSFVIAHRLSTIINADKILVVDGGRIVETGTHDELLSKGGVYNQIYYSQYKAGAFPTSEDGRPDKPNLL